MVMQKAMLDGLCRVVKLSCTFFHHLSKKIWKLEILLILEIKYNLILSRLSVNFVILVDLENWRGCQMKVYVWAYTFSYIRPLNSP